MYEETLMKKRNLLLALALAAAVGAGLWYGFGHGRHGGGGGGPRKEAAKADFDDIPFAELPEAADPRTVELRDGETFELMIAPVRKTIQGRTVALLGYNGSIPGPTLRIPEGAEVTINLKNEGSLPTTLHSHGVRMDNAFDGTPGLTQKEIAPGESFAYRLKFSDPGAFWYHPHVRTEYAVEAGLYGGFVVTPKDADHWSPANREAVLMLDDIALDAKGLRPFDTEASDHALMGRFGGTMLVNGRTDYRLEVREGEVVRMYLTNAANTRLFNFAIPGAKMKLVGADLGRYAKEAFVDEILIAPGERRVVDVLFERAGEYAMKHRTPGREYGLGSISILSERAAQSYAREFALLRTDASVVEEAKGLMAASADKVPDRNLRLTLDMEGGMGHGMADHGAHMGGGRMMPDGTMMGGHDMGMGDDGDAYEWEDTMPAMNRNATSKTLTWKLTDEKTGKTNMDIDDWNFRVGDKVKVRIFNDPKSMHPMQHPIHFHGQRFMVLSTNGTKTENPVWQDTALIAKGDTVDILLEASNPGKWMAHCHILEHAEAGMMLPFSVN
jgi:suppressor of ftsI